MYQANQLLRRIFDVDRLLSPGGVDHGGAPEQDVIEVRTVEDLRGLAGITGIKFTEKPDGN